MRFEPLDRGEAMRDDDRGAPGHQIVEADLHQPLVLRVERAGRFVEQQQRRVAQDGARNRDALALAAGERDAALADAAFHSLAAGAR